MPPLGAGTLFPLGPVAIFLAGAKRHGTRGPCTSHPPATHISVSAFVAGDLVETAPESVDVVSVCKPSSCGVAPPRQAGTSAMVVPDKCIGVSKKAKRRRRRGGGAGDGDGMDDGPGGGRGGGEGGWDRGGWDNGGWGEGGEDSQRLMMLWAVLCVYSMVMSVKFVLFGNEKKAQAPFVAAITSTLCARVHARCRKMVSKKA